MKVGYSYLRFSSVEQAKGDSFRRQTELSTKYAEKHDISLDDSLQLQDLGVSAFKSANATEGRLSVFLAAIESGRIKPGSYLLIESFDRLARSQIMTALALLNQILSKDIIVVTLSDEKVYTKDSLNDLPNLMYSILIMSRAHEESLIKSKRVCASWESRIKNAHIKPISGRIPMWLKLEDGKIVGIPERVEVIQRIYQMSLSGMGMHVIANTLNSEGVPSFLNAGWRCASIQSILKNRAVLGECTPNKMVDGKKAAITTLVDYFPKIISEEDYAAVQVALASRRHKGGEIGKTVNIFAHLMKCKVCGSPMVKIKNNGLMYMSCDRGRRGLSKCGCTGWRYDDLLQRTLKLVSEMDLDKIGQNTKTEIDILQSQIYLIDEKINDQVIKKNNVLAAISIGGDMMSLVEMLKGIEEELKTLDYQKISIQALLNEEQHRVKASKNTLESLSKFNQNMDLATGLEVKAMLRNLVDKITIDIPKKKLNIYYKGDKVKYSFKSGNFIEFF